MKNIEIDVRLTVDESFAIQSLQHLPNRTESDLEAFSEGAIIHEIIADIPFVKSAVVLRNNGYGHLLPDENTRQER